jgi:hypothetical protein
VARNSDNSQFAIRLLTGISALETLVLAAFGLFLVLELFIATPDSMASAVFLAAIVLGFALALAAITRGLWQGKTSARSASLVWQVLQGAVGLASGEGIFARYDLALLIGAPAVIAIGLILFNRSVRDHFER